MTENNEMFDLLTKMYSEVQGIKSDINGMKSYINVRLDNIELKVDKTNIIIENDIKPKIESLFDGYKQNTESINALTDKIDDLQTDVNNLTIRTLKNENNIINFSKTLENNGLKKDAQ